MQTVLERWQRGGRPTESAVCASDFEVLTAEIAAIDNAILDYNERASPRLR